MFEQRVSLFRILGFEVRIDASWLILAILVTWTLAVGLFPAWYPDLAANTYWWMGIVGALGLFVSIIFHELSHSLVARRYGLPIKGITLFIFGGVAEMTEEPVSPKVEFLMAAAGPIASFVLAAIFYGIGAVGASADWPVPAAGVVAYLAIINVVLAAFNLVPAFPLDGGRMLRAALWAWKGRMRWATRVASNIGSGFGLVLIFLGIFNVVAGNFIGGFWWFLIGLFLRAAAGTSYRQVVVRQALEGVPVRRLMNRTPVTVSPSLPVSDLVENFFYRYYFKMFPVVDGERVLGCVTSGDVRDLPRERWPYTTVGEIMRKASSENTVSPDLDAVEAMALMNRSRNSRLLVANQGRLAGIITLKDMLSFLSLKLEFEEQEDIGLPDTESLSGDMPSPRAR
jgi:Zn-dependent protease/CBS domain-containing protein